MSPRRWWWPLLLLLALIPQAARAQTLDGDGAIHIVRPGETLPALAARWGTSVAVLMQLNHLDDPRHIYPGQPLRMAGGGEPCPLPVGESLLTLSRRAGLPWEQVTAANRRLSPAAIFPGEVLHLPPPARAAPVAAPAEPLIVALRHGVPLWTVRRLNPYPLPPDVPPLVPTWATDAPRLPFPFRAVALAPQPVVRGRTAVITLTTTTTATCTFAYLDRAETCYAGRDHRLYALVPLPPLLEPGRYPVTLTVRWAEGQTLLTLPLLVAAGRYDFERIDLPPGKTAGWDQARIQAERQRIAELRTVRTAVRHWTVPFALPLEANVTSYFGSRRSYGSGYTSFHHGTDFRAAEGTPVTAPADGVVMLAEPLVVRGNAIIIDHGWGVLTGYWHLSRIDVTVGTTVKRGEIIGRVGNTGFSTGPHLHWEMWVNGLSVDPLQWVRPFITFEP